MNPGPSEASAAKTLLLVDDEHYFRRFVGEIVRRNFGYRLIEARDGEEAVALFQAERPAVVLLDINMPRKTGIETLPALRAMDAEAQIIMLTSISEELVVEECANLGASYFVRKDLPADELVQELKAVLEAAATPDEPPAP